MSTDASGGPITDAGYYPFGTTEYVAGEDEKDSTGLYYCKACYYGTEIYGLEGDDWENFKKGFMEGVKIGMTSKKLEYDEMFANLESEVQELATDVRNAVIIAFAGEFYAFATPELLPELWAVGESIEAMNTLASAIDTLAPKEEKSKEDAGLGAYLVVLGLMTSILIQRRKKKYSRLSTEHSKIERREVKT